MKKITIIPFLIILIVSICVDSLWAEPFSQVGRLSLINGSVSIQPATLDEWAPAELNYPLTTGDHLWTDSGARAEVHLMASSLRLNSNTEFSFLNLNDETVQVRLSQGSLNVVIRSIDNDTVFEIDTPDTTVSLRTAGIYRIDVQPNWKTTVTVRSGNAEVTAGNNAYTVVVGQTTVISSSDGNSYSYNVTGAGALDEWDTWNANRDFRENQVTSSSYFSRDMIGCEDLNENGSWSVEAGYGPIWAPKSVPADWAPYRNGHWSWVEPWGWTWVDATSWGFAPFHYGRWAFLHNRWAWVPGAVQARPLYAPALVVFVGGNDWHSSAGVGIGWFPLGPHEIYIPPYHASTVYVERINVTHVTNINVQIINNYNVEHITYVNRRAPGGITMVPPDAFVNSRSTASSVLRVQSRDIEQAPVMGMRARVVPQQQSIVARRGTEAAVAQPPANLMSRRVLSRVAPPAQPVPFAQRQEALRANPGRPVAAETLSTIQRAERRAPVTVIKPTPTVPPRALTPGETRTAPPASIQDTRQRNAPIATTTTVRRVQPAPAPAPSRNPDPRRTTTTVPQRTAAPVAPRNVPPAAHVTTTTVRKPAPAVSPPRTPAPPQGQTRGGTRTTVPPVRSTVPPANRQGEQRNVTTTTVLEEDKDARRDNGNNNSRDSENEPEEKGRTRR